MDELGKELLELVRALSAVAPDIWRIALRQVWLETLQFGLWAGVALLVLVLSLVGLKKATRKEAKEAYDSDDAAVWGLACLMVAVIAGIVFMVAATALISYIGNPEWEAVRILRSLLPR